MLHASFTAEWCICRVLTARHSMLCTLWCPTQLLRHNHLWPRAVEMQVVRAAARDGTLQEDHGFSSYGLCALSERRASPYTVRVVNNLQYITLDREAVDDLLGVRASAFVHSVMCSSSALLHTGFRCQWLLVSVVSASCIQAQASGNAVHVARCRVNLYHKHCFLIFEVVD